MKIECPYCGCIMFIDFELKNNACMRCGRSVKSGRQYDVEVFIWKK